VKDSAEQSKFLRHSSGKLLRDKQVEIIDTASGARSSEARRLLAVVAN